MVYSVTMLEKQLSNIHWKRVFNLLSMMAFTTMAFVGCQTTEARGFALQFLQIPANLPPLIQFSIDQLPNISSDESKVLVIRNNAQALILQEQLDTASAMLDSAVLLVQEQFVGEQKIEAFINLSRNYIDAGNVSMSLSLLEQALEEMYKAATIQGEEALIQNIISVCFIIGDESVDLLQRVIRKIYIVRDYELRANLLLATAERYQTGGEGQRTHTLLQQAIPAVSSINTPLNQIHGYSLLGLLLTREQPPQLSQIYSLKALELLKSTNLSSNNEQQNIMLTEALIALAQTGFIDEALAFSDALTTFPSRINFLLEIARLYHLQEALSQADLMFERVLALLTNEGQPQLAISALLHVAQIYFELNDNASGQRSLTAISDYLPLLAGSLQSDQFLLEVIRQYTAISNYDQALATAESISDNVLIFQAYVVIVRQQIDEAVGANGATGIDLSDEVRSAISELLMKATMVEIQSMPVRDALLGDAAVLYARIGDVAMALELISQIMTPYHRAIGLAMVYGHPDWNAENAALVEQYQNRLSI